MKGKGKNGKRGKGKNGDDDAGPPPEEGDGTTPEWDDAEDVWQSFLEPVKRMSRDMRAAAATLGDDEARHLVDAYYTQQEDRKRAGGQQRALDASGEPHSVINWLFAQSNILEKQIKAALDVYTEHHVMGSWMRQIHGIGPVISAGLLAHIYMGEWCIVCRGHNAEQCKKRQDDKKLKLAAHDYRPVFSCPTVGHIWAFAGWAADGQKKWVKGGKRPFNARLKVLCWKAGQSFMKFSNDEQCFYGHVYREYKAKKTAQNESGGYKARAAQLVKEASPKYKLTDAYKLHNMEGKLSPGHIDNMARRYAVKLFLAHLHGEWYERVTGEAPPKPYPIAHLGHAHFTPSPIAPGPRPTPKLKSKSRSKSKPPKKRAA
jgi:hypothetical protein